MHPDLYGRGIGTALIPAALDETKAPLRAEVLHGNAAAIALYPKAGFEVVKYEHGRMPGNEAFEDAVTVLRHPGVA